MTVKELKAELEFYNEDAEVIFNFDDPSVEVESWTEDKYGYKTVRIDCNLEPTFMSEFRGDLRIELGVKEDKTEWDKAESEDNIDKYKANKCKNCEYYQNPDYTRCHECKAESED